MFLGGGIIGVQVGMPALALGAVGFLDLFLTGTALDAKDFIGIFHRITSSQLSIAMWKKGMPAAPRWARPLSSFQKLIYFIV